MQVLPQAIRLVVHSWISLLFLYAQQGHLLAQINSLPVQISNEIVMIILPLTLHDILYCQLLLTAENG